jgi:hypothetical protein
MLLTGHPFIDVGLGISANISQKKSISDLTENDLHLAVRELINKIDELSKLKILKYFWQNNPLMGINIGQLAKYSNVLEKLSNNSLEKEFGFCQICGKKGVIRNINRSWFPLAGSPDNDPTTLPELEGKQICPSCFCAVLILPFGGLYCKTGPYFYHIMDPSLQIQAIKEAQDKLNNLFASSNFNNRIFGNRQLKVDTHLSGRLELLEIVSGHLLWDHTQQNMASLSKLPKGGATMIAFSNDKSAKLIQLHLPAQALEFFSYLRARGMLVYKCFLNLAKACEGEIFEKICDDIEQRRSLAPLIRTILKKRNQNYKISREEKLVIQDYEIIALQKNERFDVLERLAGRVIKEMEEKYRTSFIKQLSNTYTMKKFLELLRLFAKPEKTGFLISSQELRAIATDINPTEVISLFYLLCISEQSKEN